MNLANNISTATFTSDPIRVRLHSSDYRMVHVEVTATATVSIQGRIGTNMPWVEISSFTATGLDMIAVPPEIRVSIAANTGTVNVTADII